MSLRELSLFEDFTEYFGNTEYDDWDADKIYGCLCDEGWEGPLCNQRSCPKGVDPEIAQDSAIREVQYLECQCSKCQGGLHLQLDNEVSAFLPFDVTAPVVKRELEEFRGIDTVDVKLLQGDGICSSDGSTLQITFLQPRGPQNRLKIILAQGLAGNYIAIRAKGENARLLSYRIASFASNEVLVTCSNRGNCDYSKGTCMCQKGYTSSDGYGNPGNRGDCGYLEREINVYSYKVDGDAIIVSSPCPIDGKGHVCSGHGWCESSAGRCTCHDGYQGFDCSEKQCPKDYAWFGLVGQDHKQSIVECSGVGDCDRATGTCKCLNGAYGGVACERLTCAADTKTGLECGGQGVCLPMWQLARYAYSSAKELANIAYDNAWDAGKIYGCLCDRAISVDGQFDETYLTLQPFVQQSTFFNHSLGSNQSESNEFRTSTALLTAADFVRFQRSPYAKAATDYFGYVCTEKKCPKGDVPTLYNHAGDTLLHKNEIQQLLCRANNGTFTLTFRENTTLPIDFNATTNELKYRLEQLFTIGNVDVTISGEKFASYGGESTVCSSERNTSVLIEFLTEHGDLPMLRADVSKLDMNGEYVFDSFYTGNFMLNITEYQRGTTQDVECSGTGICDTKEGRCHCMEGFFSSNGSVYAPGETGDCSYFNPYYTIDALVNGQPRNRKQRRGLDTNA
jgi:hypothetical protein